MMDTIYSILGAILPLEAYQYSFMKNAFLAILQQIGRAHV